MGQTPSVATLLQRAFPAGRILSDAELHRLVDELEHRLQMQQRGRPARAAHYSIGDYLKYEPDA